jgi:hypothetical protein
MNRYFSYICTITLTTTVLRIGDTALISCVVRGRNIVTTELHNSMMHAINASHHMLQRKMVLVPLRPSHCAPSMRDNTKLPEDDNSEVDCCRSQVRDGDSLRNIVPLGFCILFIQWKRSNWNSILLLLLLLLIIIIILRHWTLF